MTPSSPMDQMHVHSSLKDGVIHDLSPAVSPLPTALIAKTSVQNSNYLELIPHSNI